MTLEEMIRHLKTKLDEKRYLHSLNVMDTAVRIAKVYGADINKARIAGLLHDCAKHIKGDTARNMAREIGYIADDIEMHQTRLLHGPIGACIAKDEYGVKEVDVLDAIRWHTTGRADMSLLEKIIYVADYIEPSRSFKEVEKYRELALTDIDRCIVNCADNTIRYILKKGYLIHPKTIEARNYILMQK